MKLPQTRPRPQNPSLLQLCRVPSGPALTPPRWSRPPHKPSPLWLPTPALSLGPAHSSISPVPPSLPHFRASPGTPPPLSFRTPPAAAVSSGAPFSAFCSLEACIYASNPSLSLGPRSSDRPLALRCSLSGHSTCQSIYDRTWAAICPRDRFYTSAV